MVTTLGESPQDDGGPRRWPTMIWIVDFMVGFALMVVGCSAATGVVIGSMYAGRWLGWEFRRASLAREAQGVMARDRVRQRVID
ncbi:MAG: hypothetical protein AAF081_12490 [Actinomycetota bacterium]